MRPMKWAIGSCILSIAISVAALYGHHSIAGVYDGSRQVKIEGTVAEFHFVNPHPFLIVDVKNDVKNGGGTKQWRLEMDNRYELEEVGMNAETLKEGDRIVVSGSPGRTQSQSLYIRRLDRPADSFRYEQVGSSPRVQFSAKP